MNIERVTVELDRGKLKECAESLKVTSKITVGTESEQQEGK